MHENNTVAPSNKMLKPVSPASPVTSPNPRFKVVSPLTSAAATASVQSSPAANPSSANLQESASDFLTAQRALEFLNKQNLGNGVQENTPVKVTEEDSSALLSQGYTIEEIQRLCLAGMTPAVLRKIIQKQQDQKTTFDPMESIETIRALINMGMTESTKAKKRDLILVVGDSGTGKSTAVNWFAGCTMEEQKMTGCHKKNLVVSPQSAIPEVMAIGHKESRTLIPCVGVMQSNEAFCDCPGFHDNRGQEINISNAVNIKNVIMASRSVKLLVLIPYAALIGADKGRQAKNLQKTIDDLFGQEEGQENSLVKYQESILIGITRVPLIDDDGIVTGQIVLDDMFADGLFPAELRASTLLLEPMGKRDKEGYSRQVWLDRIKKLKPVNNHQSVFKTILTAADEVLLTRVSRTLSDQMLSALSQSQLNEAYRSLNCMRYLENIGRQELTQLYQDNIKTLTQYVHGKINEIRRYSAEANFHEADADLLKLLDCVALFKVFNPQLEADLMVCIEFNNEKRLQKALEDAVQARKYFSDAYHKNSDLSKKLAYSLHQLFNLSNSPIQHAEARKNVSEYLKKLSQFGELKEVVNALLHKLTALHSIAHLLNQHETYEQQCTQLTQEFRLIAEQAKKQHEEQSIQKLSQIKLNILQSLGQLKEVIVWETNGREILPLLEAITSDNFIQILAKLRELSYLNNEMEVIYNQMINAQEIVKTLSCDDDLMKLTDFFYLRFMELKTQLLAAKEQEETRIKKENEAKMVKDFIQESVKALKIKSFSKFSTLFQILDGMNAEQCKSLEADPNIGTTLKGELREALSTITTQLHWEQYGAQFLMVLQNKKLEESELAAVLNVLSTEPAFKEAQGFFMTVNECFIVGKHLAEKQIVDSKEFSAIILRGLSQIHKDFSKKKEEEDLRKQQELARQEALKLVENINRDLDNFEEVKKAILLLEKQAPDLLPQIVLDTYVRNKVEAFHTSLKSQQYPVVLEKLQALEKLKNILGPFFAKLGGVQLDIHQLRIVIQKHVNELFGTAKRELQSAFDLSAIETPNQSLIPLPSVENFFEVTKIFSTLEVVAGCYTALTQEIIHKIEQLFNRYNVDQREDCTKYYAKLLTQTQLLTSVIGVRDANLTKAIRDHVGRCIKAIASDIHFLAKLDVRLSALGDENSSDSQYAKEVFSQYPEFRGAQRRAFIGETAARHNLEYIGDIQNVEHENLRRAYTKYTADYVSIIEEIHHKYGTAEDSKILTNALTKARSLGAKLSNTRNYFQYAEEIAEMVANIFGVWSYLDAHNGSYMPGITQLRLPHASQLNAIFLLFGLGHGKAWQNHFIEVKTGEGKSVITAGAAIALALLGFSVEIACYNPYLAKRDERIFAELIQQFQLSDKISYGDFEDLLEHHITSLGGVRAFAKSLVEGKSFSVETQVQEKPILFVDEVDVLFSPAYLGRTYNPSTTLPSDAYYDLVLHIWDERENYSKLPEEEFKEKIRQHQHTSSFLDNYPGASVLIDKIINHLFTGLSEVLNGRHNYVNHQGHIGYFDEISNAIRYNTIYFGSTEFAAAKEYNEGRIALEEFKNKVAPSISAGQLSYAELLKNYTRILGVTGTLFPLSAFEDNFLTQNGIELRTRIPTVFAKKQKLEKPYPVAICAGEKDAPDENGYFLSIKQKIEEYVRQDRAILVIFQDESTLAAYNNKFSNHYDVNGIKTNTLSVRTPHVERNLMIFEAATRARVTLMVCAYGRGSDFVCHDSALRRNGGVAVICAFFPETELSEIQYKGRTCRQNDPGSFEMILHFDDLKKRFERFGLTSQTELGEDNLYTKLSDLRQKEQEEMSQETAKKIASAADKHQKTMEFVSLMNSSKSGFFTSRSTEQEKALTLLKAFNC